MGELFSGPGGMARGAHDAAERVPGIRLEHGWANDFDFDTCETYRKNIPGANKLTVIHKNVHDLELGRLGRIDGFAFGFPCNDYSLVGEWRGLDGNFGPLYTYGVKVLESHRPKWFVAENVSGLRGANEGKAFRQILDHLQNPSVGLRYRLVPHLYSFDEYGVPQRRQRVVIVGIRDDLDVEFRVPQPTNSPDAKSVTAGYALNHPRMAGDLPNHEYTRQSDQVIERLMYIKPGENAFTAHLPEHLKINTKATLSQVYKRLRADQPSYTVTGGGGGGTHVYHWDQPRALTNRERARLQSFPDDFVFSGLRGSVRKQIGMAVPVRGADAIFTALFRSFQGIDYPSKSANLSGLVTPV
jgi:DNA (cytosine-5)-methyltransferase 1